MFKTELINIEKDLNDIKGKVTLESSIQEKLNLSLTAYRDNLSYICDNLLGRSLIKNLKTFASKQHKII